MKSKHLIPALILVAGSSILFNGCKKEEDSDTTGPVISLNGSSSVDVVLNSSYTDAGATATDDVSGSVSVSTNNPVNTDSAATYTVTYTATDGAGNSSSATRTVNVVIERSNYIWAGYAALDTAASTGYFTYSGNFAAGSSADQIIISNFSGTLANCVASVNGADVTIASQTVGAYTMVGSGTMNALGTVVTINYNDGIENHIAVFTKQ